MARKHPRNIPIHCLMRRDIHILDPLRCGSTDRLDILGNSTLPGPHASPPGYIGSALMHTANVEYDTPERKYFCTIADRDNY